MRRQNRDPLAEKVARQQLTYLLQPSILILNLVLPEGSQSDHTNLEKDLILNCHSTHKNQTLNDGSCRFFGLFGCVLKIFLHNVSPVSVAGIFRGQELELCLCSGVVCGKVEYL